MLDTVKINHVQHISFTQSRLTDAVSVILSELLSYEHPSNKRGLFLNFSGSFYFRHKLYVKNFHHQPHPAFQAFLKGGLFPGAAHRPLPVQTFTLFPSVNPQLLRVLAIRSWPADCYKLYSLISNGLISFLL